MSAQRIDILRRLRPPFTRPIRVVYAYSKAAPINLGLTLAVDVGQPVVAPGDGNVDMIAPLGARWRNDLGTVQTIAVRIDHGLGIKTIIHGLGQSAAQYGPISRGQLLGYAGQVQVFFAVEFNHTYQDPTHINQHLGLMNGCFLRQAPDLVTTTVTVLQSLPDSVLFNLDFNGQGNKSGPAVVGAAGDAWNSIAPLDFAPQETYGNLGDCAGCVAFPAAQGLFLNDFNGSPTKVYFERGALTASAGTSSFFDSMLSSWVGGYSGTVPLVNSFTLRNLPSGTYACYVYANGGTTSDNSIFHCSVSGTTMAGTATPTVEAAWVETGNYVAFTDLIVTSKGSVAVSSDGYLAGLQLKRQDAS